MGDVLFKLVFAGFLLMFFDAYVVVLNDFVVLVWCAVVRFWSVFLASFWAVALYVFGGFPC